MYGNVETRVKREEGNQPRSTVTLTLSTLTFASQLGEERMEHRSFCSDSVSRIELQHSGDEIKSEVIKLWDDIFQATRRKLGDFLHDLVIRKLMNSRPLFARWSAENFENFHQLIAIISATEEWSSSEHLSKDAANAPDINRCAIFGVAKKNIRWSVPQCDDLEN